MDSLQNIIEQAAVRTPRFRLRTILIAIAIASLLLLGIIFVGIKDKLIPKLQHRLAVERVAKSGSKIWFADQSVLGAENPHTTPNSNNWRDVAILVVANDSQANIVAQELVRLPEAHTVCIQPAVTNQGLAALCVSEGADSIEGFQFDQSAINSNGFTNLARLTKLRTIMFNTSAIDSKGLAQLRGIQSLQYLMFVEEGPRANPNRLDDSCFIELGQLSNLQTLNLGGQAVSDFGAQQLHDLKQLKLLVLSASLISKKAESELRAALPTTKFLILQK